MMIKRFILIIFLFLLLGVGGVCATEVTIKANDTSAKSYTADVVVAGASLLINLTHCKIGTSFKTFTEFSSADYTAIGSSNNIYTSDFTTCYLFNVTIPTYTSINWIFLSGEEGGTDLSGEYLGIYIYNFTSNSFTTGSTISGTSADVTVTHNQTNNFNGFISNNILYFGVNCTYGNAWKMDYAYITVSYTSNVAPTINSVVEPTDPTVYSQNGAYTFYQNITDTDGANEISKANFTFGGTTYVMTNYTNTTTTNWKYNYTLVDLAVQSNTAWNFCVNDTSGASVCNSTGTGFTVSQATPTFTLTGSNVTYNNNPNIVASESNSVDGSCTYNLYRNNSLIGTGSSLTNTTVLSAGNYNFTYNTTGCTNFTTGEKQMWIVVSKGTPSLTLTLDGSSTSSQTRTYPNNTNIQSSESNSVDSDCTYVFARNGSVISNGAITLGVSVYNITYNNTQCTNFTANHIERVLTVNKGDPLIHLVLNATEGNKTYLYSDVINATGYTNLTSLQDVAFNLYQNDSLIDSTSPYHQTLSQLNVFAHKFVFNTSGGTNYTSSSLTYYADKFNYTFSNPIQNTTLNVVEDTKYDVTWNVTLNITSPATRTVNVSLNYTIPSQFIPRVIEIHNSTNNVTAIAYSNYNISWNSSSINAVSSILEYAVWNCTECVNVSSTTIIENDNEYEKNVSLETPLSSYHVTVSQLTIDLTNRYSSSLFDLNVYYSNGTSASHTDTVSSGVFSNTLISNILLSNETIHVHITKKPTSPGSPGGGGGTLGECIIEGVICSVPSDCCGGLTCDNFKCASIENITLIPSQFAFDVTPRYIQPDPLFSIISPGSHYCYDNIIIYNAEKDTANILIPAWEWTCSSETKCLSNFCTFFANENITQIEANNYGRFSMCCDIPVDAKTESECEEVGCNIYDGTLNIYPRGYNKNLTIPVYITLGVSKTMPLIQKPKEFAMSVVGFFNKPLYSFKTPIKVLNYEIKDVKVWMVVPLVSMLWGMVYFVLKWKIWVF